MGWISRQRARIARSILPRKTFLTDRSRKADVQRLIAALRPVAMSRPLIRMGPSGDGGYLVPDDLDGIGACFSPGVSTEAGFELDCAELGMQVFLADASVDQPPSSHENFEFRKNFIGANTYADFVTLAQWVRESDCLSSQDLLLQMDIEGAEYEALLATPTDLLRRFRIMVIEFHDLDQLWNRRFFSIAEAVFKKLLDTHVCVHLHPNNYYPLFEFEELAIPPLLEITLVRRDRCPVNMGRAVLPHSLDVDNTSNPPVELPRYWFGDA